MASGDYFDSGSVSETSLSNADPASSPKGAESKGENEARARGYSIEAPGVQPIVDEPALGGQIEGPAQVRRIEIGLVEGDAMILGGASQMFLRIHGKSTAGDIIEDDHEVVRFARLPARSELRVPYDVEVVVGEITGDGNVIHVSGPVNIGRVGGNLLVVDAPGGVLAEVGGDAVLDTSLSVHAKFVVHAVTNITLRTHDEINARFVAQTSQGEIQTRLPLMVERGRRRNLVGVIGRGDATVNLRSQYGDITIIAANNDERDYSMNKDFASSDKEQEKEGAQIWEGGFGRTRFRAQWHRGPGHARFHFQGPFTGDNDPDGFGVPFSPDFGFEWERGRGARTYGEYEERWDDLREKAERTARRAAKRARRYADRATRYIRDTNLDAVEREVLGAVEKAMTELEEALASIRSEWNKRLEGSESSKSKQSSKAQRVRIEYDKVDEPFDEDSSTGSTGTASSTPLSREERDAQRRAILEELRSAAISLEEAERRLNNLE